MGMQLRDKVFVVTGGGDGIGRQVVLRLLSRGARVAAVDLRPEALAETRALAEDADERLSEHVADVTDLDALRALADDVVQTHGQVDGLVNSAGIVQPFLRFTELDHDQMARVLNVNFWGVVNSCQVFLPLLQQRPEASLVNLSSMAGFNAVVGQAMYSASKAAVKLFTEVLYAELRGTAVAVTVVCPGSVATSISDNSGVAAPGGRAATKESQAAWMTSPQDAARQIVKAIRSGSFRVMIGADAKLLDQFARLAPHHTTDLTSAMMSALLDKS